MIWDHIIIPLAAVLVLGFLEFRSTKNFLEWLVNVGWDSSVLALGAGPAVFLGPGGVNLCGREAAHWGFLFELIACGGGIMAGELRRKKAKKGRHAIYSLMIGGALLGSL